MDNRIADYLSRIGAADLYEVSSSNLATLQKAHLLSVPYENIDIWKGCAAPLSYDNLFDKIVTRRRGGYCFELNGLFAWLLRQLGYNVVEYFGRWLKGEALAVPARRHRILMVTVEEREFIVDVGVGQRTPLTPLEFIYDKVQAREGADYRIVKNMRNESVVEIYSDGNWVSLYSFDSAPQEAIDFNYVHYYCVNEPSSFFRNNLLVHLPSENGRKAISMAPDPETGMSVPLLSISLNGECSATYLRTSSALKAALEEHFGIMDAL